MSSIWKTVAYFAQIKHGTTLTQDLTGCGTAVLKFTLDSNSALEDLPLVQTFDVSWDWPIEFFGIWLDYPDYVEYIKTGGTVNTDWCLEANRMDANLWSHSLFFILGQATVAWLASTPQRQGWRFWNQAKQRSLVATVTESLSPLAVAKKYFYPLLLNSLKLD